jgi:hypothetical protein
LTTTNTEVTQALAEIQKHIADILNDKTDDVFLSQQRCFASKTPTTMKKLRQTLVPTPVPLLTCPGLQYWRPHMGDSVSGVR